MSWAEVNVACERAYCCRQGSILPVKSTRANELYEDSESVHPLLTMCTEGVRVVLEEGCSQ